MHYVIISPQSQRHTNGGGGKNIALRGRAKLILSNNNMNVPFCYYYFLILKCIQNSFGRYKKPLHHYAAHLYHHLSTSRTRADRKAEHRSTT